MLLARVGQLVGGVYVTLGYEGAIEVTCFAEALPGVAGNYGYGEEVARYESHGGEGGQCYGKECLSKMLFHCVDVVVVCFQGTILVKTFG